MSKMDYRERCQICGGNHQTGACFEAGKLKKSKEKKESAAPAEISKEFLVGLYTSENFVRRLKTASTRTNRDRDEWGFEVLKQINSDKVRFGRVVGSTRADHTALLDSTIDFQDKLIDTSSENPNLSDYYPFSSLHFHPPEEGSVIIPSGKEGDLGMANSIRRHMAGIYGYNLPVVQLTGINTKNGINILAYRESEVMDPRLIPSEFNNLDENLLYSNTKDEVLDHLRSMKYIAEMLHADNKGKLDAASVDRLGAFAYKPTKYIGK
jgi:hypothetical protein